MRAASVLACLSPALAAACLCLALWRPLPPQPLHVTRTVIDQRGRATAVRMPALIQAVFMGIGLGPYLMVTQDPKAIVASRSPENERIASSTYLSRVFPGISRLRFPLAQAETGSFNLETLLSLRPDVVVTWARLAEYFERIGLPTAAVLPLASTARLASATSLYADIVGQAKRGEAIVVRSRALRSKVAADIASHTTTRPRLLFLLPLAAGRWQVAPGFPDIVAEAGGIDIGTGPARIGLLDAERLMALAPDVIVVIGGPAAGLVTPARLMADPILADVPAIRAGRVYAAPPGVSGHMMTTMELPIQARWLADVLHGRDLKPGARAMAAQVYSTEFGVAPFESDLDHMLAAGAGTPTGGDRR